MGLIMVREKSPTQRDHVTESAVFVLALQLLGRCGMQLEKFLGNVLCVIVVKPPLNYSTCNTESYKHSEFHLFIHSDLE